MATAHADTEQAVLNMLHRYKVMTLDEILISGQPNFSWAQVFLAIDRLSRQKRIALHRTGSNYQVALSTQVWTIAQASQPKESSAHPR